MKKIALLIFATTGIIMWLHEPKTNAQRPELQPINFDDTLKVYDLTAIEKTTDSTLSVIKKTVKESRLFKEKIKELNNKLTQKQDTIYKNIIKKEISYKTDTITKLDTIYITDTIKTRKNIFGKTKKID